MKATNLLIAAICLLSTSLFQTANAATFPLILEYITNGKTIIDGLESIIKLTDSSGETPNDKIKVSFNETISQLRLSVTGGNIAHSVGYQIDLNGVFWKGNLRIQETSGPFTEDVVTVGGSLLHILGPHADDALGGTLNIENTQFGDDSRLTKIRNTTEHFSNQHYDSWKGQLSGNLIKGSVFGEKDEISNYTFAMDGNHVPIPAAVWLFGSGLVSLGFLTRKKKPA